MRPGVAAVAALLFAVPAHARAPEVVSWQDAGSYVGQVITVEGTVASAYVAAGACTLEFAPDDPTALRVVLVLSLFSAPAAPERLYAGRRVRASGRVQKFEGRPEMILRRADQIEVMDEASTTTTTTAPPPRPRATAPAPPASTLPDAGPRGGARPARAERCARARDGVVAARRELAARAEDAARCLAAVTARCQEERDAVAQALETLRVRETGADSACE